MNENFTNNVFCSKCGASNLGSSKFCIKCGNELHSENREEEKAGASVSNFGEIVQNTSVEAPIENTVDVGMTEAIRGEEFSREVDFNQNSSAGSTSASSIGGKLNYFQYILFAMLKPFSKFKEEENNLSSLKESAILTAIVAGVATVCSLVTSMINAVRVTSFWTSKTEWVWENLKEVEYFKVIGLNLIIYVGVIFGIAAIYYLASLVLKKDSKYPRLLGVSVTAITPAVACIAIISPILSMISTELGIIVGVVGVIYAVVILIELMNDTISIENKNTKIYFHLVCISVTVLVLGFVAYKIILGSITSGFGSMLDLFG